MCVYIYIYIHTYSTTPVWNSDPKQLPCSEVPDRVASFASNPSLINDMWLQLHVYIYIYIYMCILASLLLVLYAYIMVSVKKHSFWTSLCPATQQQKPLSSPWFGVFQVNISACIILWRSVFVHRHRYHLSFGAVFLFNRKLSAEVAINVSYVMDCETTSVVYYLAGNAKTRLLVPGCTTPLTKRNNCQNSGGLLQST